MMACATKKNNSNNSKRSEREESWTFADDLGINDDGIIGQYPKSDFQFSGWSNQKISLDRQVEQNFFSSFLQKIGKFDDFFQNFADAKLTSNKY